MPAESSRNKFGVRRASGKMRDVIAAIVVFLSLGWVLAIVASPVLPAPLAAAVYLIGSHICHQQADRSFHLFGAQLAVCARCTGIYIGAV